MTENGQIEWLPKQISFALNKVRGNLETFKELVPPAASLNQIYYPEENIDWTASFWPGMLFLAKELTNSTEFDEVIATQMASFQHRLDEQIELETHDIGFLYILTAIADYQVNGHEASKEMALQAADLLMKRYSPKAKIIQAWGNLDDPEQRGRMIIDHYYTLQQK